MPSLELDRCEHTQRGVATLTIVEDLEVLEDGTGQFDSSHPALSVEEFDLHAAPEGLDDRVEAPMSSSPRGAWHDRRAMMSVNTSLAI